LLDEMITRILLYFGIAIIDLDLVARALASDILRMHGADIVTLEAEGTRREMRRKYAILATETGLPIQAQRKAADMAWSFIRAAQDDPDYTEVRKDFSFYA
jgi:hypothetical protein